MPLAASPLPPSVDQRPRVVGVHGDVRVATGRLHDLLEQPDDRDPERETDESGRHEAGDRGGQEPDRPAAEPAPILGSLDEVAANDHDRRERDQDPELGLDDRRDRGQDRGPLGPPPPELADGEHQEEGAHRIDLGPDRAVEPGDRHEQEDPGRRDRGAPPGPQLRRQGEDGQGEGQIGEDRRQLEELVDGDARRLGDEAEPPEDIQVAGRVVDEHAAVVEAPRAIPGKLHRPATEAPQVNLEPGAGQQNVCDDEPKGEAEREKGAEGDDGVPHANPGLLAGPLALGRSGAWHGLLVRPPGTSAEVDGSIAQGMRPDPGRSLLPVLARPPVTAPLPGSCGLPGAHR